MHNTGDMMFWLLSIARKLDQGYRYFFFLKKQLHTSSLVSSSSKDLKNISSTCYKVRNFFFIKMLSPVLRMNKNANIHTDVGCIVVLILTNMLFMKVHVSVELWFQVKNIEKKIWNTPRNTYTCMSNFVFQS